MPAWAGIQWRDGRAFAGNSIQKPLSRVRNPASLSLASGLCRRDGWASHYAGGA